MSMRVGLGPRNQASDKSLSRTEAWGLAPEACKSVQVYRKVGEVCERPRRKEVVHIRQGRLQSARERRVVGRADERVQPDEAVTASLQACNLLAQQLRIAAIPSVRYQEDDGPAVEYAAHPSLMQHPERVANPSPA